MSEALYDRTTFEIVLLKCRVRNHFQREGIS